MSISTAMLYNADPIRFQRAFWPKVKLYRAQQEIVYSVEYNIVTVVRAANEVGKDFVAAYIALRGILKPCTSRVICTSVKDDHLRVLFGEIEWWIDNCKYPLRKEEGGPLIVNHRDIKKIVKGRECPISYLRGMVSEKGEGMAGHHAQYTLGIIDEASGVADHVDEQMDTWAKRKLIFGNPNPCTNFFYKTNKEGDIVAT